MRLAASHALQSIWNTQGHRIGNEPNVTDGMVEGQSQMEALTRTTIARSRPSPRSPSSVAPAEAQARLLAIVPDALRMKAWNGKFVGREQRPLMVRSFPYARDKNGLAYWDAHEIHVFCTEDDERNASILIHELAHIVEGNTGQDNSLSAGHGTLFMHLWLNGICEALASSWAPLTLSVEDVGEVERAIEGANEQLRARLR